MKLLNDSINLQI